jgi:thioredoxin reductase (NADPH)
MPRDTERARDEDVSVVGGGTSAGQAAVHLARTARSVSVVVGGDGLASTMSRYLLSRIEHRRNIEVVTNTEVTEIHGATSLDAVTLRDGRDGSERRVPVTAVYCMIGAEPCTEGYAAQLGMDAAGYVVCGEGAASANRGGPAGPDCGRTPLLLETVRPGVFAAGDVRSGATKRVSGAVGDGALAVRFAHQVLDV